MVQCVEGVISLLKRYTGIRWCCYDLTTCTVTGSLAHEMQYVHVTLHVTILQAILLAEVY